VSDLNWRAAAALLVLTLGCGEGPTDLPDASRDRIVFTSNAAGNYDIYAMDADGNNQVQLTVTGTEDVKPAPSPDGARIAFISYDGALGGGDIYVMNVDGTGVTQLTGLPGQFTGYATWASWSPDGARILFTGHLAAPAEQFVMDADGNNQINLTNDDSAPDEYGAWSPDGRQIAFVRWTIEGGREGGGQRPHLHVMDADGGHVRQLTSGDVYDLWPAWSPDSRRIVFARLTANAAISRIFTMSSAGTGLRPLSDDEGEEGQPSWSRDGKRLLFNSSRGSSAPASDIWVSRGDGTQGTNLTYTPLVHDDDPRWLPVP
jgi:TolB protein